mmetsp:Transcript_1030/g.1936  ORF Transcript_1030/g.1936 Transcript_1030/m.1936 type:complete len:200 (-) Transcript_1030:1227-1826(-)
MHLQCIAGRDLELDSRLTQRNTLLSNCDDSGGVRTNLWERQVHHTTHIVSPGHQFVVEEHATAHDRLFTAGHRSARACLHPSSRCCHRCVTGGVSSCLVRSSRDASKVTPSAKCRSRTLHFMGGSTRLGSNSASTCRSERCPIPTRTARVSRHKGVRCHPSIQRRHSSLPSAAASAGDRSPRGIERVPPAAWMIGISAS